MTDEATWRAAEARLEAPRRANATLSLRADSLEQVLAQYDRLAAAVAAGERWQWRLPLGFWKWNAALAAHIAARGEHPPRSLADPHHPEEPDAAGLTGACGYGRVVAGGGVREKVRSLLRALNASEETAAQQHGQSGVLAGPWLASTGSSDCIARPGAALRTREKRPSTSDPSGRPCLSS